MKFVLEIVKFIFYFKIQRENTDTDIDTSINDDSHEVDNFPWVVEVQVKKILNKSPTLFVPLQYYFYQSHLMVFNIVSDINSGMIREELRDYLNVRVLVNLLGIVCDVVT